MKKIEIKMITLIAIFSLSCFSNTFAFTLFQQSLSDRVVKSSIIGLKATYSTDDATKILEEFDLKQATFVKDVSDKMTAGEASTKFVEDYNGDLNSIREAVLSLTEYAAEERTSTDLKFGRVMLGICGLTVEECLSCLKSWVTNCSLPRGLLHGADVGGVPIDTSTFGRAFIKYNTGGAMTFEELRATGRGFDALWIPGDAMLESYDGDYRGVYYNIELQDGVFRQYGLLPLDIFER